MADVNFEAIPAELKACPHWVLWNYEPDKNGKITKVPYQARRRSKASTTDPKTWSTFADVRKIFPEGYDGIGFVFTRDSYSGIDLDHCRDPSTGALDSWAMKYLAILKSYSEISPSDEGLHVIVKGDIPEGRTGGKKNLVGPDYKPKTAIEIYSEGRFFTVTGNSLFLNIGDIKNTIQDRQDELRALYLELFGVDEPKGKDKYNEKTTTVPHPSNEDDVIINRMLLSKNGDKIKLLWEGSWIGYPSQSEADQALCNYLAFWCGKDSIQMDRIFRQSKLMRPKWDEKHGNLTYGEITINEAIAGTTEVYKSPIDTEEIIKHFQPGVSEEDFPKFDELDICDIITHKETNKETGKEYEWKEFKFNHAKAADSIIIKLPVVLGLDGSLYYFQGTTWSNQAEAILYNILHRLAGKQFTQHQHKEVIAALLNLLTFSKVKLDPDPWLLGVSNGVVDLRTSEFRDYRKEDYISYSINVKYDILATCPRFILFLEEVCPRVVDRLTLVDWLTIHAIGKQFPYVQFLLGNGRNGKGVYEKLLIAIYERSAFSFIGLDELQKSVFAKANLAGKRGLIVSEAGDENVKGKAILPTKFLKGSTGDGIIDSDRKNKDRVQFDPIFKGTIDCNDMPTIKDRSRGWEERFCKVDMPYIFVENPDAENIFERKKDPRLIDKLTTPEELSGILNLIILRAAEIFKTEAIIRRSGKTTMAEYLVQSNSLRAFLDAFCEYAFEVKAEEAATIRDVYPAYERFCLFPPKEKADIRYFGAAVKKLCGGYNPKKINNVNRYAGFVFYEDEFEEYMKSLSDPSDQSKINQDSITDQSDQSYNDMWTKMFLGQNRVEIKKSNFEVLSDSIDPIAISKEEFSKPSDPLLNPVDGTKAESKVKWV